MGEDRKNREKDARREKKQFELREFVGMLDRFSRWQKARQIREYLTELEKLAIENNRFTKEFEEWLTRARDKTDWFDPMIEKENEWLEGVDRDNLFNSVKKFREY